MSERYHVVSRARSRDTLDSQHLATRLASDGQLLLPMLDLIENAQTAIDDLIDVMGHATFSRSPSHRRSFWHLWGCSV
jgi:hypothetical protein